MEYERCGGQCDKHQNDCAPPLGSRRTAEEPPPDDNRHPAQESEEDAEFLGLWDDDGDDKPEQPLQHHDDHAGPQTELLLRSRFAGLRDIRLSHGLISSL